MTQDPGKTATRSLPAAACCLVFVLAACEAPAPAPIVASEPVAPAAGDATGAVAAPASLTSDERIIWNSLTDAAKREALEFIRNGGTLTQFVAV